VGRTRLARVLDPDKDRGVILPLVFGQAEILYLRSSTHPVKYAIVLRINRDGEWKTAVVVDNSHEGRPDVDANHMHRYLDDQKQPPEPLPFPAVDANEAMFKAIDWMTDNWEDFL
jgi:hypothetical protein